MTDDLDPNDPIVGFLRSTDPGDPPVTLGPGSSLRHRAAVRHARRQAVGAVLAVALIGVAVVGSVAGTRHHASVTTAAHDPIASVSISTRADQSPMPSHSASVAPSTGGPTQVVSVANPTVSESVVAHTQAASPAPPVALNPYVRNPGPITVGQPVFFTIHYTRQGSIAANTIFTDFGDGSTSGDGETCTTRIPAPTSSAAPSAAEVQTISHPYAAPGTYTVKVTISFGCVTGTEPTTVSRTIVVTGPAPSTSVTPSAPASESPSPSVSPSAPALGSPTPAP